MAPEGEEDVLDLAELARASRVSPRTIRYYIHQGLIPSPGKRGRGARYDRGLLDRLELIKLLQRDAWPLAKIANHLAELDEEGVRRELGAPPELPLGDGPPSYVRESEFPPPYETSRSTWERVRVGPKVEISVRTPLSSEERKLVDRLVQAARKIFEPL
jgi:DNA-binding transcriptional MerR regulator